jgi:hypothetical protein
VQKIDNIDKALEIANSIEDNYHKAEALSSIAQKTDDKELMNKALEVASSIKYDWDKSKALSSIMEKTDDKELMDKALKIANAIRDDWDKFKALSSIVQKTDDKGLLAKALEIANLTKSNIKKAKIFKILHSKKLNTTYFPNNILYKQTLNHFFAIQDSIKITTIYNEDAVLRHFGVNLTDSVDTNEFENIISSLQQLKSDAEKAYEEEDEAVADKLLNGIEKETAEIKDRILADKDLLKEFLTSYNLKKIKFKKMNILDLNYD